MLTAFNNNQLSSNIPKSENVAADKLCGEAVALEIPRKLTFCNVVGCKTEILRLQSCKSQLFKITN